MSQPLLEALLSSPGAMRVDRDGAAKVKDPGPGRLGVLFFTGDPARHPETADVAVVLRELMRIHEDTLSLGIVDRQSQSALMKEEGVFALPALAFYAHGQRLETIPKIKDWSVYAEAVPRLRAAACNSAAAEA